MKAQTIITCTARGVLLGFTLFGIAAHLELLVAATFTAAALPLGLAAGLAIAFLGAPPAPSASIATGPDRWSGALLLLVLVPIAAALVHGALATPARHWDGICTWELRANFLTSAPTIDQPFFAEPMVFSPSRDYPLLQPLCVAAVNRLFGAGIGRLVLPGVYLLLVALVHAAVAPATRRASLASLAAAAVAVTPALVNPTMGAADSGFAEVFLAAAVAAAAAGILRGDALLLAAAVACAVMLKPEGLVYGAVAVAVAWCSARPRLLRAAIAGWLGAAALWIPIQLRLAAAGTSPPPAWVLLLAMAALFAVVLGSDALLRRRGLDAAQRVRFALLLAPVVGLVLPIVLAATGPVGGTMQLYLGDPSRPFERLGRLPAILLGYIDHALLRLDFALTFALPLVLAGVWWARRRRPTHGTLAAFVGCGLLVILPSFLLSPEDDVDHHIRSSMSRLLMHWAGAIWILSAVWIADLSPAPAATPRTTP